MTPTSHVWQTTALFALTFTVSPVTTLDAQQDRPHPVDPSFLAGLEYRMVGPTRGGRATAVEGVATIPGTFYMGATGGGVWKTTDYGQSWHNVSDGYFHTGSIGAIDAADSDHEILFVGTGSDGIRSNVITGKGVYKSTDAGKTWRHVGLWDAGQIGAVEIHPQNPNIVFVAAIGHAFGPNPDRGVYRTTDGGESWENVLFVSDSTGAVDLEYAPDNTQEIYATMWRAERKPWTIISGAHEGGVYKSTDGGSTWNKLTEGLPSGLFGKADLAVSPADPNRVYVLIEAPVGDGGLYRSDDRGATFRLVTTYAPLLDRPFYYLNLDADPTNADVLFSNSTRFYRSDDAGESWERRSTPHGDNHDIWIDPNNPDVWVQSNDGGANVTRDGGRTWSTQSNQPTAELYQVNVDDQFPYWLYAGQQDNSTISVPSIPPASRPGGSTAYWLSIGGCETGPAVPKPGNHNIVYANCKGRFGRYSKLTGQEKQYYVGAQNLYGHNPKDLKQRFQRVSPIEISPHDADVVYHASQFLHVTRDDGVTWEQISPDLTAFDPATQVASGMPITRDITGEEFFSAIYAVEESPLEPGVIWVGANDGPIHVTRDAGATWHDVTPRDIGAFGRVQALEPSPHRPGKAYAAIYRYLLDDFQPYIYRTDDYGQSWMRLTTGMNGIPEDHPTHVVREDPDREGLLYAGTEFGMFLSFNDGGSWQPFQQNLPVTPITDIKVYRQDLVISTMGRSFWIMDNLTPLHQLTPEFVASVGSGPVHFLKPRDAHRMRYRTFAPNASGPSYPQASVMLDYYLPSEATGEVTLEILDGGGNVIRAFSSEAPGEEWEEPAEPTMRAPILVPVGTPRLPKSAGGQRFAWDMRHAGAWDADLRRAGRSGPMAVPGTYTARVQVADIVQSQQFQIMIDPRVAADGVTLYDLESQLDLSLQVRDLMSLAKITAHRIDVLRKEVRAWTAEASEQENLTAQAKQVDDKLAALEAEFVNADTRYPQQMFLSQVNYLFGMINRADQPPGRDASERLGELEAELREHMGALETIEANDIARLAATGSGK